MTQRVDVSLNPNTNNLSVFVGMCSVIYLCVILSSFGVSGGLCAVTA